MPGCSHKATTSYPSLDQSTLSYVRPHIHMLHVLRTRHQSCTFLQNIKENIEALNVKLTAEEVEQIRQAAVNADQKDVPRYPPQHQALLMVDTPPLE